MNAAEVRAAFVSLYPDSTPRSATEIQEAHDA